MLKDTKMQELIESMHAEMGKLIAARRNYVNVHREHAKAQIFSGPSAEWDQPLAGLAKALANVCEAAARQDIL